MSYIRNTRICRQCGICAADCSPLRLGLMASAGPHANPESPHCEQCGHCYSLCPHGAIVATEVPPLPTHLRPVREDGILTSASLFDLLAARRSERRFTEKSIPEETVFALLLAAAQTPSGGNARTIGCSLLYDDETRRSLLSEIRGFYQRLSAIAKHPIPRRIVGAMLGKVAGAFLNDPEYRRRFVALVDAIDTGVDSVFYHAPLVMLFHTEALMPTPEEDAVLAAYNVALLAGALGLGSCFVSMAQKSIAASRKVRRATGLPAGQRVLAVLAVGYPVVKRQRPVIHAALPATLVGGQP